MLREAGALEVHVRIASPPVRWPCFYGIDFATRAELVASGLDVEGVRRSIGADTLGYISLDGLIAASEQPRSRLCMACFDGDYPIPLPEEARLGKHLLEDLVRAPERTPAVDVSGAASRSTPGPVSGARPADPASRSFVRGARRRRSDQRPPELGSRRAAGPPDGLDRPGAAPATPPRASTSTPVSAPSRRCGRTRRRPAVPRCSAASAGSPACSPPGWAATASRCSPPRRTASAPRSRSPRPSTSTTRSGWTWWPWSSTTWSCAGPSRCSCRTTSPSARWCPSRSRRSSRGSPRAAGRPAARCWAGRRPSTRA